MQTGINTPTPIISKDLLPQDYCKRVMTKMEISQPYVSLVRLNRMKKPRTPETARRQKQVKDLLFKMSVDYQSLDFEDFSKAWPLPEQVEAQNQAKKEFTHA